jgi:hypothetical protein
MSFGRSGGALVELLEWLEDKVLQQIYSDINERYIYGYEDSASQ